MTLADFDGLFRSWGPGSGIGSRPTKGGARRGARSRPVLYRAIDSETPVPSRGTVLRSSAASAILEQRADIALRLAHRGFDFAQAKRPRLGRRLARQRLGIRGGCGSAPGADRRCRAFERVGGVSPVLVGAGRLQPLDIDQGLGAEELQNFPLKFALAERVTRKMHKIDRPRGSLASLLGLRNVVPNRQFASHEAGSPSAFSGSQLAPNRALGP